MRDAFTELQLDALCLNHALLGVISPNFRLVSVTRQANRITVRIVLATRNDEDMEEIEDLKTEFEALYPGPIDYDFEVTVSEDPIILEPPSDSTIAVFLRRER